MTTVGLPSFELDESEAVIQESPTICSVEFDKQGDFFESVLGKKTKGRVVTKPYLTNKRLILWMCVVPEELEPKMFWYTLPIENIIYMRQGKEGKVEKGKKGLEIEFGAPKVGGVSTILSKKLDQSGKKIDESVDYVGGMVGGVVGWLGHKMGEEKMKMWLYVPDMMMWNLHITKILQSLGKLRV
jgi:hypothetical protein